MNVICSIRQDHFYRIFLRKKYIKIVKISKVKHVEVLVIVLGGQMILGRDVIALSPIGLPSATDLEPREHAQLHFIFGPLSARLGHISDVIADI